MTVTKQADLKTSKVVGLFFADTLKPDLDKKVKPKRSLICVLAVLVGFFAAVVLAFAIEFIRNVKANDPQRFAMPADELRVFGRRRGEQETVGEGV